MNKELGVYINLACNVYCNRYPQQVDEYLERNKKDIQMALIHLKELRDHFPVKRLYRGILVDPSSLVKMNKKLYLAPMKNLKYISFSECREGAEIFADPNSSMSDMVMTLHPNYKGYMIEYIPEPDEILIHWRWSLILKIPELIEQTGITGSYQSLIEQREVTLWQKNKMFEVTPFVKGQE